jgi:RNA polymerase sigma-70 factor (ECF subfamily)
MPPFVNMEEPFEMWYSAIFRYFRLRGLNADFANDLASNAIERALQQLDTFDPRNDAFNTWLFTIVRNSAANDWKTLAGDHQLDKKTFKDAPEALPLDGESISSIDEGDDLLTATADLVGREREILALKFSACLTNRQIAGLTDLSESIVGEILYRVFNFLQSRMAKAPLEVPFE